MVGVADGVHIPNLAALARLVRRGGHRLPARAGEGAGLLGDVAVEVVVPLPSRHPAGEEAGRLRRLPLAPGALLQGRVLSLGHRRLGHGGLGGRRVADPQRLVQLSRRLGADMLLGQEVLDGHVVVTEIQALLRPLVGVPLVLVHHVVAALLARHLRHLRRDTLGAPPQAFLVCLHLRQTLERVLGQVVDRHVIGDLGLLVGELEPIHRGGVLQCLPRQAGTIKREAAPRGRTLADRRVHERLFVEHRVLGGEHLGDV